MTRGKRGADDLGWIEPLNKKRRPADSGVSGNDAAFAGLKAKIKQELEAGHPDWEGRAIDIDRYENPVEEGTRRRLNYMALRHGCHTCLDKVAISTKQPWIGDHIPPTQLPAKLKAKLRARYPGRLAAGTVLFPQCDRCASNQAVLVRKLKAKSEAEWDAWLTKHGPDSDKAKLLLGGKPLAKSTPATGPKVSVAQSAQIQFLGATDGCHSCGTQRPASLYHADHCPPVEFHRPTIQKICEKMGIAIPPYQAKPQCPKCSHGQGGRLSALHKALTQAGKLFGLPIYW